MAVNFSSSNLFLGNTVVHRLIRTHDWSHSSIGFPAQWPSALRVLVGMMLDSKLAMSVVWGPERTLLYNDPYIQFLSHKHPSALGQPLPDVWPEIWEDIEPLVDRARAGESFHVEDLPLTILRNGKKQQGWFSFYYSPLRNDAGELSGMCSSVVEVTSRVLAEKRQAFLLSLSDTLRHQSTSTAILEKATELIGQHLNVSQMMYGEANVEQDTIVFHANYTNGHVAPLTGSFSLSGYGPECVDGIVQGKNVIINDIETDPRIQEPIIQANYAMAGARAVLSVPLGKQGSRMAVLVANDVKPRHWTEEEVTLVEEVAQRTWSAVEQVHAEQALRQLNQTLEQNVAVRTAELERTQQEATRVANRLKFTLEAARFGEWSLNLRTGKVASSSRHGQCFGYPGPIPDWTMERFLAHLYPDDRGWVTEKLQAAVKELRDWHAEYRVVWPDNSVHWVSSHGSVYSEGGVPSYMLGMVADITQRKRVEEDLIKSEARQTMLLALGDQLRDLADEPDAMIGAATHAVARILNVPRVGYLNFDEVDGHGIIGDVYNDPARMPSLPQIIERPDDYGTLLMDEIRAGRILRIDDITVDPRAADAAAKAHARIGARASLAAPIQRNGRTVAFLFAHDDKPRHWTDDDAELMRQTADRTWEAVERARAIIALREADKRKDEFLAMLAHELRNPLAPISAAADLFRFVTMDEARIKQTSEIISRQVQHMTGLVDDLLDVSRVTRGLVALEKSEIDVKSVLTSAVEQVRPLLEARKHHYSLHMSPEPALAFGNQKRLIQIVVNLLNNAAKYTPEGGNITLDLQVEEQQLLLTVSDNGIGMAPELVARAFELFAQAERTSDRSQGGLGIGLALVKSLVELHGGKVTAQSEGLGKGSKFIVQLPRLKAVKEETVAQRIDVALVKSARPLKIMIVDDNVDAARMLAMLTETFGHQVIVENDPRRALERASAEVPDVCLLDIGLPDMDGNELAQRLRSRPQTAAAVLVAITGYGQEQDRKNALEAGFDYHFVKPMDSTRLAKLLREIEQAPGQDLRLI